MKWMNKTWKFSPLFQSTVIDVFEQAQALEKCWSVDLEIDFGMLRVQGVDSLEKLPQDAWIQ